MKLLALCCLVATAFAAPGAPRFNPADVQVLRYDNDVSPDGFRYAIEPSDVYRNETQGTLVKAGKEVALPVKGMFSFVINGVTYNVNYTANETGYQPTINQDPGGGVPPGAVASLLSRVEQSNGSVAIPVPVNETQGTLVKAGEQVPLPVKGMFSFVINGVTYNVNYTANQNGYQPTIKQDPGGGVPPEAVASLLSRVEQSDGYRNETQGTLAKAGEEVALPVKGMFSFVINGITYNVNYTATENGYQSTIEQGPGGGVPPGVVASLLG